MALNVGHLVGYLELDDKRFNRSAANADKKMTALQLHLKALAATNPKIQIDVETRKLDELKAKMADLKAQAAKGVDVRVEIAQALVEIDRVEMKLRMLHNREVRIDVDNRSALAKIGAVGAKINGLWTAVLGLGPMLVPLAAASAGGILAIGSASVAAATGVGVLVTAFAGLSKATTALATYREAVAQAGPKAKIQSAQLALGVATAQKAYAKHPTAINAQKLQIARQKQAQGPASLITARNTLEKSPYGDQTKAGKEFARFTLDTLKPATSRLHASAQSAVLPGVERGLRSLLPMVPLFDRLITHVGHSLGDMAARAGKALTDPFWRHFFQWISQTAGPTLTTMGHTFGMVFEGISRVLMRFGPQGQSLVLWIDHLATKFNAWSQGGAGSSFQRFMDYVAQSGPAVEGVLKPLGVIVGNLLAGMSSTGMGELHVFGILLSGIAHLPTGAIQTIGVVLPGIILALKGMQFVSALAAGINGLAGSFGNLARNAEGAAATGALGGGGGKTAGRIGGVIAGVSIAASAGSIHNSKGQALANIGGGALAGASLGAGIGSVIPGVGTGVGAAAGGLIGGLAGLYRQLHMVKSATKTGAGAWQDYASTLDGVNAHATRATRAMAYQKLEASGMLDATRKLGLTDRTVVQAVMGNVDARKKLGDALASEQATHKAGLSDQVIKSIYDETAAVGKKRLEQLKMNLAIAETPKEVARAKAALEDFRRTNGTAKVGLTGAEKTVRQLRTLHRLIAGLTGVNPVPGSGAMTNPGLTGSEPAPGSGAMTNPTKGGLGGILGSVSGRALGGPVAAGHLYKIREMGPELFAPKVSGEIISNSTLRAMAASNRGGGVTLDDLRALIKGMQPLYGDVHISGDPTVFRREMQGDARRAQLSGMRP